MRVCTTGVKRYVPLMLECTENVDAVRGDAVSVDAVSVDAVSVDSENVGL